MNKSTLNHEDFDSAIANFVGFIPALALAIYPTARWERIYTMTCDLTPQPRFVDTSA